MTATTPSADFSGNLRLMLAGGMRWLVIGHRWLGIFTCVFCALWFISGVVMMYVPYPYLSDGDRTAYSEPLDWKAVKVAPDQALAAAGVKKFPSQLRLTMLGREPVYRLQQDRKPVVVSAADGRVIQGVDAAQARAMIQRLLPDKTLGPVQTVVRDPWNVQPSSDPYRPFYKVPVERSGGLELYVSSKTGEVMNDTHRAERGWNYVGSLVHWLYITGTRQSNEAWHIVVVWTSGPAIVGAIGGLWLGIVRLRLKRREGQPMSPYCGWMKWHHWFGLVAGVFVVTWLISGWLSMHPLKLLSRRGEPPAMTAYTGQEVARFETSLAVLNSLPNGAHEARLSWVGGRPLVALIAPDLKETTFDARTGAAAALTDAALFASARALIPDAPVAFAKRLTEEDVYWYSHRQNPRRLPVLRIGFADPAHTWFHIDPDTGEILGRTDDTGRAYRWWFNLLHDFDLPILLRHRPVWDLLMWGLSIAGLVISVSGIVIGWRHLKLKIGPRRPSKLAAARQAANDKSGEAHA